MRQIFFLWVTLFSLAAFSQSTQFGNFTVTGNLTSQQNVIDGYSTIVTAGGTTNLSQNSPGLEYFTGTSNQTVKLPAVNLLVLGEAYTIVNLSSGTLTLQSSGGNTLQAMATNTQIVATVISLSGTGTASWSWSYGALTAGTVSSVAMTVPTFLSVSGSPITSSGTLAVSLSGTALPTANGGTGQTALNSTVFTTLYETIATTLGDTVYGGASGAPTRLAGDTSNNKVFLREQASGGVAAAPSWNQIACADLSNSAASCSTDATNAANISSGLLALARGGTHADLSGTGGASQVLKQTSSGGNITVAQLACSDLSNAANSCSTTAATSPTASDIAEWDSHSNMSANAFIPGYATNTTGGTTTTLTVSSAYQQYFTGSTTQTVALPSTATMVTGEGFFIVNNSTGVVTVQTSTSATVQAMSASSWAFFTVVSTANNNAASWNASYFSASSPSFSGLTADAIIYASGTTSVASMASAGSVGQVATSNGSSSAPTMQEVFNDYNFLVNSGFDYWQVGTSATDTATGGGSPTATYLYQADQWYVNNILGGGTIEGIITYSQQAASVNGSGFAAKVLITTAPTGTGIQNGAELYQPLSAKASRRLYNQTASFSIQVEAFGNVNQAGLQFYYATSEAKPTNAIGSETTCSISSGSYTLCSISGQALGTSQTTSGIIGVRIRPTAVSSGHLYDLNNGFQVEQGMLNLGSVAHTWHRQSEGPAQELAACQYFYEKSYDVDTAPGTVTNNGAATTLAPTSAFVIPIRYSVHKRINNGTINTCNPVSGTCGTGSSGSCRDESSSSNGTISGTDHQGKSGHNITSASTDGHEYSCHWTVDARI